MISIQIISDLHLEWYNEPFDFLKTADYLAVLGDLGCPNSDLFKDFVLTQADRYKFVFIIAGNHENYHSSVEETNIRIFQMCRQKNNLIFLNRTYYDLSPDIRILGCTLWSEILPHQTSTIRCFISDFRCISDLSINRYNQLHYQDKSWLIDEISRADRDKKRVIVLTHHCPSFDNTSQPRHKSSPLSSAFCTSLDHLLESPVILWAHGHSHYTYDITLDSGCRLVANQRGFSEDHSGFDPEFYVKIDQ